MATILKATSRGQVTIPMAWRKRFKTDQFIATMNNDTLEITPLLLDDQEKTSDYTVFDAIRDNNGQGIKADDLVKILKKLQA